MDIIEAQLPQLSSMLALYDEYDRPESNWPSLAQQKNIFNALQQSGGCILIALKREFIVGTCTLNICPFTSNYASLAIRNSQFYFDRFFS